MGRGVPIFFLPLIGEFMRKRERTPIPKSYLLFGRKKE